MIARMVSPVMSRIMQDEVVGSQGISKFVIWISVEISIEQQQIVS